MYLLIQYYNDRNPERQKEYDFCLQNNLDNPAIKEIHNIIEKETIVPDKFKNNPKLKNIAFDYSKNGTIPGRLTFKYAFEYANKNIPKNEVICIINLDIMIPKLKQWLNIKEEFFNEDKRVLCLSRYEYSWDGAYKMASAQFIGSSSDTWIFLNYIDEIKDCNFAIGNSPGCDGAIARRFYNKGYTIFNWAKKYITLHVDICRGHVLTNTMIFNNKTDFSTKQALLRGRLDCPPIQDWDKILNKQIKPIYKLSN